MKYYLIAGEASGDLHGSNLMRQLKQTDRKAEFRFFGGDLMQNAGGTMVRHYKDTAFMGFLNVIINIQKIRHNLKLCKHDLLNYRPDVLILIDYPGFNLRIAEFAKKHHIKVFYYISPKIWAWKTHRIKKIRAFVDEMFTILPFETGFYKKYGMKAHYVGNPLMDAIGEYREKALSKEAFFNKNNLDDRPVVALLAGSRVQEVKKTLPLMTKISNHFTDFQFVIAGVNHIDKSLYRHLTGNPEVKIIFDQTYDLLNHAHSALVASGTAALETALFNVPQIVIYKVEGGLLVDVIMRNFVLKTIGVALPNIIMNEMIVTELIQKKMTLKNCKAETEKLLLDENYRKKIFGSYARLKAIMGGQGCSRRAAEKMVERIK